MWIMPQPFIMQMKSVSRSRFGRFFGAVNYFGIPTKNADDKAIFGQKALRKGMHHLELIFLQCLLSNHSNELLFTSELGLRLNCYGELNVPSACHKYFKVWFRYIRLNWSHWQCYPEKIEINCMISSGDWSNRLEEISNSKLQAYQLKQY